MKSRVKYEDLTEDALSGFKPTVQIASGHHGVNKRLIVVVDIHKNSLVYRVEYACLVRDYTNLATAIGVYNDLR